VTAIQSYGVDMLPKKVHDISTPQGKRKLALQRLGAMKTERSSFFAHWSDVSRHLLPRSGRFFVGDRNRSGRDRYNSILDNSGTRALRVLGAGLMAGATSPARPWFKLTTPDPDLNRFYAVELWLDDTAERMHRVFAKSNTYRVLHQMYEQMGAFGTAVSVVLPDFNQVIHHYPVTCGQYCLQQDWQGQVNTVYREFEKSVAEVVREFGWANCSRSVQQAWNDHSLEQPVKLLHVIEPRDDTERRPGSPLARDMAWKSIYFELGDDDTKILRESGFDYFPVLAPRWTVDGDDTYGTSPGMESLGDVRQLQQEQLRKGQGIDYQTKPPLQVPSNLANRENEALPGGITYYEPGMLLPFDQVSPNSGIRAAFEVNLKLDHLLMDIQDVRQRIQQSFFTDLFLMLAQAGAGSNMTATEVMERHEEKLLMLGPTLERLHNELLQPMIDITFREMLRVGALLPPPPELAGVSLSVEFVSILAQAQRLAGANGVDRFVGGALAIAKGGRPDVLDNVNWDKWSRIYGRQLGVPSEMLVREEDVQAVRQARAQAEAQRDAVMLNRQTAAAQRDLANSPTDGGNALSDMQEQQEQESAA
jgi:hypothetical protein